MGLLSYLQRQIASFIQPWILRKDIIEPVILHFHLSEIVLELQHIELDCGAINSLPLLSSSSFLLRQAHLDRAKLTISFFRTPGVFLLIDGLHFVSDVRPAEDSFWCDRQKQIAQNIKREAIAALDPQGASVHVAAERRAKKEADSLSLKTLFLSVVLQALRIELLNASTVYYLDAMDGCNHIYSIHLESLILEEESGLARAVVRRLTNVLKQVDEAFCKLCSVQQFGLQLAISTKGGIQSVKTAHGSEAQTVHRLISKDNVLMWKRVSLILEFQNDQVTGVEAFVTETMLQVSLADVEAFVTDASQLQGLSRTPITAHDLKNAKMPLRRGRYLWKRAVEKITSGSWKNLMDVVESGVLRKRYSQLYASWLLKAGEGLFNEINVLRFVNDTEREKNDLKSLERDLFVLEQELPVEVIVLARSVAQHRVLEATREHCRPARPLNFPLLSKVVSCLLASWGTLNEVGKFLVRMIKCFSKSLYIFINPVLNFIWFYWLYSKLKYAMTKIFSSLSYLASQSNQEDSQMMAGSLEGLHERRLPRTRNMTGGVNFASTFHTGSLTYTGSLDHVPLDTVSKGSRRSFPAVAGVQFSWGNVSVVYMSSDDVVRSKLVFGYLQGEVVAFSISHADKTAAMKNTDYQGLVLPRTSEGSKFLQSGPAPPACIPESVQAYFDPGDVSGGGLSSFMDFMVKEKPPSYFAEEAHDNHTLPFLSFSSEMTRAKFATPERHSDMIMCSLSVGYLDCNLDLDVLVQLWLLLAQFLGVVSANEHSLNDKAHHTDLTTGNSNTSGIGWEVLYINQLKQFISTIVLDRRMWLLIAIDNPKLQFSGFFLNSNKSDKDADGAVGDESILVVCLGHMDAIVWPTKVEHDSLDLENSDNAVRSPFSESRKLKVWARRPPSPKIQGEKAVANSSQHEQIGHNGLISAQGFVLALQAIKGSKEFSLAGPMKMIWEFSQFRNYFLSPFGVCNVVSAAALGSFSGLSSGILVEDIQTMSKVSKSIATAFQQFSDLKGLKRRDDQQMLRKEDSIAVFSGNSTLSQLQPVYFAIFVDIRVNELDCIIWDSRGSKGARTSQETAKHERYYVNDSSNLSYIQEEGFNWVECLGVYGNMDHLLVKDLWLKFSWGDGCVLLASCGFEEVSLSIAKDENGALVENSKEKSPVKFSNYLKSGVTSTSDRSVKDKCYLVAKQCFLKLQRPWYLSNVMDDMEAQRMAVGFELKKLHVIDGASESLVNKALSRATSATNLSIDIAMSKDFESISVISKGGMLVLHIQALLLLLQEWCNILSLKSASLELNSSEIRSISAMIHSVAQESSLFSPPSFQKSSSLPMRYTQMKESKHRRLSSAPIGFSSSEEETYLNGPPWLPRRFSLELLGLYLLMAQTHSTSAGKESGGFLLEMGAILKLQRSVKSQTMSFEISRFSLCSLQSSQGKYLRPGKGQASQIPKFGSLSLAAESENTEDVKDSPPSLSSSRMEGSSREKTNDFIVENWSISLCLENDSGYLGQLGSPDGWRGSCSFLDIDIGITTSEIQLLLALFSSLSGLSLGSKNDTIKSLRDSQETHVEQVPDNVFEVPDGSIVALKDALEHLYMAVEGIGEKYRLGGVLHHSLVGDRALFKIKYQKDSRDSMPWFSLLSIGAKNADGEPFRVHYRPGSGLADISSTHDGSWELWQTLPYKYSAKDDGDIALCSVLNKNLVCLVNQKSKQGLTLASGSPMMVKKPGSPFKIKIMRLGGVIDNTCAQLELLPSVKNAQEPKDSPSTTVAECQKIEVKPGKVVFTLLYETGGGKHLLPLLRGRLEDATAVMHIHSCKFRLIGDCKFAFEYLEAHVDKWSMIIQPMDVGLFYRLRTHLEAKGEGVKLRTSFFARCKKVDIAISETSLDMMLFVIGLLNFAGPCTIKRSPVLAMSCMVQNHTGLQLCCLFDTKDNKEILKIPAWGTETFFVRNMFSRRDLWPAKVLSVVSFYLEKESVGWSSPIRTSIVEASTMAARTCLERKNGHRKGSGPIIVVDVSKRSEDGIIVTVSPMIRIHNASGLSLELRCQRSNSNGEGVIVPLKDGDIVDDLMGAFDALDLEGELKKALSSFNLGGYLLSIRPLPASNPVSGNEGNKVSEFDWSEDIKGAKPIRISGFFEKLQYGLRKSLKGCNTSDSFGTVFCRTNASKCEDSNLDGIQGMHILIQSTCRQIPLSSMTPSAKHEGSRSVVAWLEQKELVLLPTLRIHNFLDSKISLMYSISGGTFDKQCAHKLHIEQACQVSMYADLSELAFSVEVHKLKLMSKHVSIGEWSKSFECSSVSSPAEYFKELELELDFGNNYHYAMLKLFHASDGVLQALVYTQYAVRNRSDFALSCCVPKQSRYFWAPWKRGSKVQWPSGEHGMVLQSGVTISLLTRSSYLLLQMAERLSETSSLDLDSLSGSTELSLNISHENGLIEQIHLGVRMEITEAGNIDPTRTINISSRYIASNQSAEAIFICQDGFQEDESAAFFLKAGEHLSLRTCYFPRHESNIVGQSQFSGCDLASASICSVRFRLQEKGWDWTGPICASALGSFSLRIRRNSESLHNLQAYSQIENISKFKFVAVNVEEESPSLVVRFHMQSPDMVPYRIENALSQASIFFFQKGLDDVLTTLEPGQVIAYAWDDLSKPHKLVLSVPGTQVYNEVKLDKLTPWRSFHGVKLKKGFGLRLPFVNQPAGTVNKGAQLSFNADQTNVGYEISADGSQRVLRVCEDINSSKLRQWQSHISFPSARIEFRIPVFGITLFENAKQRNMVASGESSDDMSILSPIISMRISSLFVEILNTQKHVLLQLKVQTLSIEEKWEGAPFAAMVRVHSEDRFKKGETVLHMAAIISNQVFDPIHVKYMSILLQAIDVNLDEETMMKLVPFYRYSLAESSSSQQFYFERLEIHPIKIVASFLPGQPLADYTSAQETFRALLHSFIKVPSIRGSTVELNGVLLSHALLTFRQLAIKCAQHYSWYAMRAVYIAKGSNLLPPAFASIFDDSAASALDVFFDPSNGSIDLQGLTLGMFNLLSEGLSKKGFSGTSRYIGDLEHKMKAAGSNILFAVLTEVSDNVLKGAETGGLDGMVNGFRRGILNVSMEPSLLQTAIVKGGSSRRIKLDHSAGIDETYVEGYLQGMLDTLFKQHYLKVKVVDDQVLLKNLPPSSVLIDEIMGSVKDFLVREGLLVGEASAAAMHSLRRLQGENDKRIVPAVVALCEQLFVIFAVRALHNHARSWFHWDIGAGRASSAMWGRHSKEEKNAKAQPEPNSGQENKRGIKGIVFSFVLSSAMAYIDGRLCRHIPNTLARRIVSGFLLSFVE